MMEKGTIEFFNFDKGFGFIKYSKGDIFFHINDVTPASDKDKINEGIEVEFVVGKGKKGKSAAKQIKILHKERRQNILVDNDISNINYFLPQDTMQTITPENIDNFNLSLNRTPYFDNDKFIFYKRDRKGKEIINITKKFHINNDIIKSLSDRHRETIRRLHTCERIVACSFAPDWRLIVGIGHESVYETSITLHHIYGIPFIPGQAIKGVTRSWIITEVFGQDEKDALKDRLFCRIFGSPKESATGEHQGLVLFFDAFPTTVPKLELDIMNPHYGEYYQGKQPPADYLNPVPIPFLTVGKNTKFEFTVGKRRVKTTRDISKDSSSPLISECKDLTIDSEPHEVALAWLKRALTEHGIGAKTAVGYGYLNLIDKGHAFVV